MLWKRLYWVIEQGSVDLTDLVSKTYAMPSGFNCNLTIEILSIAPTLHISF